MKHLNNLKHLLSTTNGKRAKRKMMTKARKNRMMRIKIKRQGY